MILTDRLFTENKYHHSCIYPYISFGVKLPIKKSMNIGTLKNSSGFRKKGKTLQQYMWLDEKIAEKNNFANYCSLYSPAPL